MRCPRHDCWCPEYCSWNSLTCTRLIWQQLVAERHLLKILDIMFANFNFQHIKNWENFFVGGRDYCGNLMVIVNWLLSLVDRQTFRVIFHGHTWIKYIICEYDLLVLVGCSTNIQADKICRSAPIVSSMFIYTLPYIWSTIIYTCASWKMGQR